MFRDIIADIVEPPAGGPLDDRGWGPRGDRARGPEVQQSKAAVVIEDEADIRSLVSEVLEQAGFEVHAAASGLEGVELVRAHDPVIATIDVSMPGIDGFETARRVREISPAYIIMLTARTEEADTLQGLLSGADDYVVKPFRPRELRARVEAMLRRPRTAPEGIPVQPSAPAAAAPPPAASQEDGWAEHKGLRAHPEMRVATLDGVELELTRSEFDILFDLLEHGRRVVSKSDLALLLRGERDTGATDWVSEHDLRAIEVHIANLRRKLGESASEPRWIETIRGVGYRLTAP